jgi:serine protease AprX
MTLTTRFAAWRWTRSSLVASLLVALCAVVLPFAIGAPARTTWGGPARVSSAIPTGHASRALTSLAAKHPDRRVDVIVQLMPGVTPAEGTRVLRSAGATDLRLVPVINGVAARLGAARAEQLSRHAEVRAASLNATVKSQTLVNFDPNKMATAFNQSVTASNLWNQATGKGVGVAVIDTGVAGDLPDFRTSSTDSTSRVVASVVTNPNATTAGDTYGHGTHVAGLVAGDSGYRSSTDALRGKYAGSAPDANLISIKASDDDGRATVLDVIYGLQFAVEHKSDYNIRVVNLSLESTQAESYATDPLDAAVESAWFNGIVVVAAAGNRGTASDAVNYAPGNDPYAIAVGGVDDQGTKDTNDDLMADWSSRGTTQDGFAKPDFYAPGAHIVSNLSPNSAFASLCPTCLTANNEYIRAGGTSMAAPIVSGVVADILQKRPNWTPDQVKGAILHTLKPLPSGGSEINALNAYNASGDKLYSNQNLSPNGLVDPGTGTIDYTRASWSRASWSDAADPLRASWSRASWSCNCSLTSNGSVDPSRASWSRASWSTSWSL